MGDYRDGGGSLLQSGDTPFVNQYGVLGAADQPRVLTPPAGGSNGTPTPGGGGTPTISLSAYELTFASKTGGSNPPMQSIQLTNSGSGTLTFTVGTPPSWLVITPTSGAAPSTLNISILNAGLTPATYGAYVNITAPGALGSPATLHVVLIVESDGTLPAVDPIFKSAWLGYFKTVAYTAGPPVAIAQNTTVACTGTANCCIVLKDGDFANPSDWDWATMQRTASTEIAALGGKIVIGATEAEILNMKPYWDRVNGIYVALEAMSGSNVLERQQAAERLIRDTRAIIWREGLSNRPFIVYHTLTEINSITYWLDGMDWLGLGAYLDYIGPESADAVRARLNAQVQSSLAKITPMIPVGGKVTLIAQAYDRNGTWTDASSLEALQRGYADLLRAYTQFNGIFWFAYTRDGGVTTYPQLTPWHKATYQAIAGTPTVEIPPFRAYGVLETCNATTISGWAFDPDHPDKAVQVQIFNGPRTRVDNSNRVAQLTANIMRPDVISITRDAGAHGFTTNTPAVLLDGAPHKVWTYGIRYQDPTAYAQSQVPLVNVPGSITGTGGGGTTGPGVIASGRTFIYNNATFTWKEATCFMAVKLILNGGASAMDSRLNYWASKGVNVLRVFGMCSGIDDWAGWEFNPSTPNYYTAWGNLLSAAASRNIVIEACLMSDVTFIPPYNIQSSRIAFVKDFATRMASYKNFTIEMCNEPRHAYSDISPTDMVALGNAVKSVDTNRQITYGSPNGSGGTEYNLPPTSYLVIHSDRYSEWDWVIDLFNPAHQTINQSLIPLVDNEPINATSLAANQDWDEGRWYAYGLGSQLRPFSSCFHYQGGRTSELPDAFTETLLDRWLQGRNEVPLSWGGSYFYGTYPTNGNSPFLNTGAERLCVGRYKAGSVVALVIAPVGWVPSVRPGWTYNTPRVVPDKDNIDAAYYLTATYP